MEHRKTSSLIWLLAFAVNGGAFAMQAPSLPDGPGKAEVQRVCGSCHGVDIVIKQRMSGPEWSGVVNDMVSRGAQGTQDDFNRVVKYLGAHFGKDAPQSPGSAPAAAPAAPAPEPSAAAAPDAGVLLPGDAAKGKALVASNGCFGCHRIAETGSYVGPDLTTIGSRRTPQQLQHALAAPDEEVLPENRFVRVVTKDGNTVTGRILNHDAFSVQMIDSKSQLRSFLTAKLQSLTILEKGLMPSFKDKLDAAQMTDIVKYLNSLKEAEKQ